jgi:uncharacterized protein YndB with AHSA1/START domain
MAERSVVHATFTIERDYPAAPARVFNAFADPAAKAKWFGAPDSSDSKASMDFRVGGREHSSGKVPDGPLYTFDALYQDIVPNERIVYTYDMHLDGNRISVSLTTIELKPDGAGTRMTFTEQGVFLDGYDDPTGREDGTRWLMGKLGESLREQAGA